MRTYLDWEKLRENRCPQCGAEFNSFNSEIIRCRCGFKISEQRYKEIIADMDRRRFEKEHDKQANKILEGYGL